MNEHRIVSVTEHSPAAKAGIRKGDRLILLNGMPVQDIFDYHYLAEDIKVTLTVRHSDDTEETYTITKGEDEDLGLVFPESLMDDYKSCYNKCIFCFIDQNPEGMRDTIYFKDDDSRLSFLQGNYITMTNMKEEEIDRIIKYKLAPINISVHTTNPELRKSMLHNRFAGNILEHIEKLYKAEIPMNGQIVLCRGVNDGEELYRTIKDLLRNIAGADSPGNSDGAGSPGNSAGAGGENDKNLPGTVAVIIGPEGGFSETEAEKIIAAGGQPVSLGKTILRTETAGPAALAMIMYELEL